MSQIKVVVIALMILGYALIGYSFHNSMKGIDRTILQLYGAPQPRATIAEVIEKQEKAVRGNYYLYLTGLTACSALVLYAIKGK